MAKILVADDNSNVQKTVALALADLGIEIAAVNNGEAAVRKLADLAPDLILADIFMPVRNGYEVCEYVKKDSRFSHVPVVLLVGAFDPLDEREAQRVGADGILKKPFVPPDPLIAMVKMLLDRTLGDRLVGVGASKPAAAMRGKAGAGVATAEEQPHAPAAQSPEEPPEEEFPPPVERVSFGEGFRPMAFGQLLETPAEEPAVAGMGAVESVSDEQILTSSRDASLGDPIFWKTEEPEPENTEENSEEERDITADPPLRAWKPDEEAASRHAEADFLQPVEPFELVREQTDEQPGQSSTIVESSAIIAQDAASQASLTVEPGKPADLAANPIEWMASVPAPPTEESPEIAPEWSATAVEAGHRTGENEEDNLKISSKPEADPPDSPAEVKASVSAAKPETSQSAAPPIASTPEQPQALSEAQVPASPKTHPSLQSLVQSAEDTARSIPKQDWADLAASLQSKSAETPEEKHESASAPAIPPRAVPGADVQTAPADSAPPAAKPLGQSAEDTARSIPKQDWADLAASLQMKSVESGSEKPATAPVTKYPSFPAGGAEITPASVAANPEKIPANAEAAAVNSTLAASPDPVLVEAVVQRILDKMRPQVVDIITKEFLRPIVQALVHREIQKR